MAMPDESTNYIADAPIIARRIVKHGSADRHVDMASAATDYLMGVSELGCTAIGDHVDIIKEGIAYVEYGGTVTRGQPLTADSVGRAIVASGSNRVIGFAEVSGVVGDIGEVFISLS
jgi:hypothetical protein